MSIFFVIAPAKTDVLATIYASSMRIFRDAYIESAEGNYSQYGNMSWTHT